MLKLKFVVSNTDVVRREGPFLRVELDQLFIYVGDSCYELRAGAESSLEVRAAASEEGMIPPKIVLRPRQNGVGVNTE